MGLDGNQDTQFSAAFQYIFAKMLYLRGSARILRGLTAPLQLGDVGHTLAEGPTELRARPQGPEPPTIRHCLYYPLCVLRRIDTWQIVYLSSKEACPKILINKSEIKIP